VCRSGIVLCCADADADAGATEPVQMEGGFVDANTQALSRGQLIREIAEQ
jgi:hypothetical protein